LYGGINMKKFLKWVPWETVALGQVFFALVLLFIVKGKILWTDWLVGIILNFLIVCGVTWSLRKFNKA
jgi:hypothetical protein